MTLANYLYALVYSGIYDKDKWQIWAENILKNAEYDQNTEWVYDVFFAYNKQKLFDVISERMLCEDYFVFNNYVLTEIIQGYYFYRYRSKEISLYEMLEKSGEVADAGQDSMGCEFFYSLLNRIDKDSNIISDPDFLEKISKYYKPLYETAMEQKRKLETATVEDLYLEI